MMHDFDDDARDREPQPRQQPGRRQFLSEMLSACGAAAPVFFGFVRVPIATQEGEYDTSDHYYGMGVDVNRCIGCGRCVNACTIENEVPEEPHFTNTWVERYIIDEAGEVVVDSPNAGMDGFPVPENDAGILKSFFVPKLCNHCDEAPCVQVCPVGATFTTEDGVVLVDEDYCIGCRYCIQACPYGARYLHPEKHVAGKCTFCYHRLVDGLVPACVEVCPTGARTFGELTDRPTPLDQFLRFNTIQVLKPHLNTQPKVYYANLDGEVR